MAPTPGWCPHQIELPPCTTRTTLFRIPYPPTSAAARAAASFSALAARALARASLRFASTSGSVIGFRFRRGVAAGSARAAAPRRPLPRRPPVRLPRAEPIRVSSARSRWFS